MQTIVVQEFLLCNWPDHLNNPDHHLQKRIVTLRRSSFTTGRPIIGIICKSKIVLTLRCFLRRWQTVCPRLTTSIPPCLCTTPTVSVEVQISTKLSTCVKKFKKTWIPRWDDEPPHPPHPPPTPPTSPSWASYGNVWRWYRSFPLTIIWYKFFSPIFLSHEWYRLFCYIITFALPVYPS